jgi:hypothetical protein
MSNRTPLRTTRGGPEEDRQFVSPSTPIIIDEAYVSQAIASDIQAMKLDIKRTVDRQMDEFRAMFEDLSRANRISTLDDDDDDDVEFPPLSTSSPVSTVQQPLRPNLGRLTPLQSRIPPYRRPAPSTAPVTDRVQTTAPATTTTADSCPVTTPAGNRPVHVIEPQDSSSRYDQAAQAKADYERRLTPSVSRFYDHNLPVKQRQVRWLDLDLAGPYNVKHDRLPKCDFTLTNDSARSFFLLYNCLRNQFSTTLFHPELLPDLSYISPTLDLTITPVDAVTLPPVGKAFGGCSYPQVHWQDEHLRLGRSLFMLFTSNKVLASS